MFGSAEHRRGLEGFEPSLEVFDNRFTEFNEVVKDEENPMDFSEVRIPLVAPNIF